MKTSHGLEFAAVWLLTKAAQILPGRLADWLALGLGKLAYLVLASRRRIAADNLRRAFKDELTDDRIREISKKAFVNVARTTIEFARQPILNHERILKMVVASEGREHLDRAIEMNKGAILISGHFGNWELLGGWAAALGYPLDFLVGHQHNQKVDEMFVSFRRALGVGIIPVGVAARRVIKSLRSGRMVAVVSDQHAASGGIVVDFFGRPASTTGRPGRIRRQGRLSHPDRRPHPRGLQPPPGGDPAADPAAGKAATPKKISPP